jgi:drug/metabolite transporter (DMT)-like permease
MLYRALAAGPLLIVSPIASSSAAVTAALALLTGERPGSVRLIGMVVTLFGVVLAAITTDGASDGKQPNPANQGTPWMSPGVPFALGAALLSGTGVWLLGFIVSGLGSYTTVFVLRITGLVFVLAFILATRRPLSPRSPGSFKLLLPIGVLDTAANWFLSVGLLSGLTSIVSVMSSLFGVVTVILGYVFAKERVTRFQRVGIVTTFVGVALVSV